MTMIQMYDAKKKKEKSEDKKNRGQKKRKKVNRQTQLDGRGGRTFVRSTPKTIESRLEIVQVARTQPGAAGNSVKRRAAFVVFNFPKCRTPKREPEAPMQKG